MGKYNALTKEELNFIRDKAGSMTIGEIALSLGRSYEVVQKKLASLGMSRSHKWTKEDDTILLSLWGKYGAAYIAERIGVDENCVYNRVRRLRKNGVLI